jgi:hypothetical protein
MFLFAWIILLFAHITDSLSLRCIYMCCKVLYFILSEDDFEIKVENLQSQPASCFESYIEFTRCLVFSEFVFYFKFLNCRLVMVDITNYLYSLFLNIFSEVEFLIVIGIEFHSTAFHKMYFVT